MCVCDSVCVSVSFTELLEMPLPSLPLTDHSPVTGREKEREERERKRGKRGEERERVRE